MNMPEFHPGRRRGVLPRTPAVRQRGNVRRFAPLGLLVNQFKDALGTRDRGEDLGVELREMLQRLKEQVGQEQKGHEAADVHALPAARHTPAADHEHGGDEDLAVRIEQRHIER